MKTIQHKIKARYRRLMDAIHNSEKNKADYEYYSRVDVERKMKIVEQYAVKDTEFYITEDDEIWYVSRASDNVLLLHKFSFISALDNKRFAKAHIGPQSIIIYPAVLYLRSQDSRLKLAEKQILVTTEY